MRMVATMKECWDSNFEEKQRKRPCLSTTANDESAVAEKKRTYTSLDGFFKAELFQIQSVSLLEAFLSELLSYCCYFGNSIVV
jgi:hypothetical protein